MVQKVAQEQQDHKDHRVKKVLLVHKDQKEILVQQDQKGIQEVKVQMVIHQ
jgi:hypothetical protein